jgi:hypothetical protein
MTIHEESAEELLDGILTHPSAAAMFAATTARLRSGAHDQRYTAWIGQTQRRPAYWPRHQVAAYLDVHSRIASGEVAKVQIYVGATPGPDADREGNADKLRRVHRRFRAHLDLTQNGADSDGTLSWDAPITLERSAGAAFIDAHGTCHPVIAPYSVHPESVPLEVGYTLPSRTRMHLDMDGAVARWAYGDDRICLLLNVAKLGHLLGVRPVPSDIEPARIGL